MSSPQITRTFLSGVRPAVREPLVRTGLLERLGAASASAFAETPAVGAGLAQAIAVAGAWLAETARPVSAP